MREYRDDDRATILNKYLIEDFTTLMNIMAMSTTLDYCH